jgi:lipoprotein signal peptidase
MRRIRIVAMVLIVAGVLGLVYDRFTYTEESHDLTIGSLEVSVKEKETINIPLWCSVGAIAAGTLLLLVRLPAR